MKPTLDRRCTAFAGSKRIASGSILEVAGAVKRHLQKMRGEAVLVFDDSSGHPLEIDWRGTSETVLKRLRESDNAQTPVRIGPGRPKLGVVSREVSLLPRHWEWLALQSGGASATLRRLVEDAKKKTRGQDRVRQAQEATHRFMTAMAGDLPLYEDALRAFYARDVVRFKHLIAPWPRDLKEFILQISAAAFD